MLARKDLAPETLLCRFWGPLISYSDTKDKPVGSVFLVVCYRRKLFRQKKVFRGTPLSIRKKACYELYRMILEKIP